MFVGEISRYLVRAAVLAVLVLVGNGFSRASIHSSTPGYRLDVGNSREVEQRLREEIERAGDDWFAVHELGTVLFRQGLVEQARGLWDRAASNEAELAVADIEIVFEQLQKGSIDAARAALARARQNRPSDPHLYLAMGQLAVAMRDRDAARAAYDKALELAPRSAMMNIARGQFFQLVGDFDSARGDFQTAVESAPNLPIAWLMLAADDFRNERIEESLANLKKAEASRAGQPLAEARLAEFYLQSGNFPDAYRWFEFALQRQPNDMLIKCRVGQMLNILNQPKRAREVFQSINDGEDFVSALVAQSQLEEATGNLELAAELLERVLKQEPDNVIANNNLAMLLVQQGQSPDRALQLIEQAKRQEPSKPEIQSTYGCVLVHVGRYAEAANVLRQSVRAQPNESWLRYCYGLSLSHTGESARAGEQFAACLLLDPDFPRKSEMVQLAKSD
jgi:cellulose synthase operon protein C